MPRETSSRIAAVTILLTLVFAGLSACRTGSSLKQPGEPAEEVTPGSGLGPLTQAAVQWLWKQAFTPDSGFYLPHIIADGSTTLGIPSYDPAQLDGKLAKVRVPIPGGDEEYLNIACKVLAGPRFIATGDLYLTLEDLLVVGLHAITQPATASHGLTFAGSQPEITTVAELGSLDGQEIPILLAPQDWNAQCVPDWQSCLGIWKSCVKNRVKACLDESQSPTYQLEVACCQPAKGAKTCGPAKPHPVKITGPFLGVVSHAQLSTVNQVTGSPGGRLAISIESIDLKIPATSDLKLEIDIDGKASSLRPLVQLIVDEGIVKGEVPKVLNGFLNSEEVKHALSKALTEEVNKWPPS